MGTPADLDRALEALYAAFSQYPLPAKIDVCDHCVSDEQVRATRAAPLRTLTASALGPYAGNAMSTWGEVGEFMHFLPRLLELLILEELNGFLHADTTMMRIGNRWTSWRRSERESIIAVCDAWWRHTLNHYPRDVDVMMMIAILADDLGLDLAPYLAEWESNSTETAARHMAWLVRDFTSGVARDIEWYALLTDWITGPAPIVIMERAFFSTGSSEVLQELFDGLETHRVWREH
ncbi:hypothetical protein ACFQ08_03790 [Streptosporangium algeriense]|uniref:Uncharacterized protein n=1 Tax=Streptosporangium algeriense TaxID=1682748 RepID=A0ABW3DIF1_9ACTN